MRLVDPVDQATGLRRLFASAPAFRSVGLLGPDPRRNARACADLALGLNRRGKQVLVLDEGRPPYNVGGMWGLLPRHGLADVPGIPLADAVLEAGPGLRLLAAPEGMRALARLDERMLLAMADQWDETPEWMLLNGRGGDPCGPGLAATAQVRVLVLPGEKAWLAEAYATLKSAHTQGTDGHWGLLVEGASLETGQRLAHSLQETARRFLGFTPTYLGCMPRPGAVARDQGSGHGSLLAESLLALPVDAAASFEHYWQRMWLFSRVALDMTAGKPGAGRNGHGNRHPG